MANQHPVRTEDNLLKPPPTPATIAESSVSLSNVTGQLLRTLNNLPALRSCPRIGFLLRTILTLGYSTACQKVILEILCGNSHVAIQDICLLPLDIFFFVRRLWACPEWPQVQGFVTTASTQYLEANSQEDIDDSHSQTVISEATHNLPEVWVSDVDPKPPEETASQSFGPSLIPSPSPGLTTKSSISTDNIVKASADTSRPPNGRTNDGEQVASRRQVICHICGKKYQRQGHLKRHMKFDHDLQQSNYLTGLSNSMNFQSQSYNTPNQSMPPFLNNPGSSSRCPVLNGSRMFRNVPANHQMLAAPSMNATNRSISPTSSTFPSKPNYQSNPLYGEVTPDQQQFIASFYENMDEATVETGSLFDPDTQALTNSYASGREPLETIANPDGGQQLTDLGGFGHQQHHLPHSYARGIKRPRSSNDPGVDDEGPHGKRRDPNWPT